MICCNYLSTILPLHRLYSDTSQPLYLSFAATSPPRYLSFTVLHCSYLSTSLPLLCYALLQLSLHLVSPPWLCSVTAISPSPLPLLRDTLMKQLVPPNFTTFYCSYSLVRYPFLNSVPSHYEDLVESTAQLSLAIPFPP
jgi:hypothetical protein